MTIQRPSITALLASRDSSPLDLSGVSPDVREYIRTLELENARLLIQLQLMEFSSICRLAQGDAAIALSNYNTQRAEIMEVTLNEMNERIELLERQSTNDHLTGLLNQMTFHNVHQKIHENCATYSLPFSYTLLNIDLNGFKQINDTLGHAAGNACLIQASKCIVHSLRQSDHITNHTADTIPATLPDANALSTIDGYGAYRVGGDEFAVLLKDVSPEQAEVIALRIATNLEKCGLHASIGLVTVDHDFCRKNPGVTPDNIRQEADSLMFKAKDEKNKYLARQMEKEGITINCIDGRIVRPEGITIKSFVATQGDNGTIKIHQIPSNSSSTEELPERPKGQIPHASIAPTLQ